MNDPLTSIRDENSILITAEFLESGEILKVGEKKICRYELDLIVKNDITANQLLVAIQEGLYRRLLERYGFDVTREDADTSFVYRDSRHPEAETTEPEEDKKAITRALNGKGARLGIGRFSRVRVKRYVKRNEELRQKEKALDRKIDKKDSSKDGSASISADEAERNCFIVCWNVFNECFEAYKTARVDDTETVCPDLIRNGTQREPLIGIGSVNYARIKDGARLFESDTFKVCLSRQFGSLSLEELGFITTTRIIFDPVGWHRSGALFDPTQVIDAFKDTVPLYNISERPYKQIDDEPVNIIPPQDPPTKPKMNHLTMILTPLLMMGMLMGMRLFGSFGENGFLTMGLMTGGMSLISLITALINVRVRNSEHRKSLQEWRVRYENYIQNLLNEITEKQAEDVEKLCALYPPACSSTDQDTDLVSKALVLNGDIYMRGKNHPDFLSVRVGTSAEESELVPSVFEISGEKQEAVFASARYQNLLNVPQAPFCILLDDEKARDKGDGSSGYLIHLPSDIAREYAYITGAPVMLSLKETHALGVVFDQPYDFYPFLSNMILDLCFYHSPDDLQCIFFFEDTDDRIKRQDAIRRFKHLPHFRELLGDVSPFAFNKKDAYLILNQLLEILSRRRDNADEAPYPHIVLFVLNEYELKRHPVAEFLPEFGEEKAKDCGISFVFCKRYTEELPRYCEKIIRRIFVSETDDRWYLLPHTQKIPHSSAVFTESDKMRYGFNADLFPPARKDMGNEVENDRYYRALKTISALYYERIAQGSDVPGKVELFDIVGDSDAEDAATLEKDLQTFIRRSWGLSKGSVKRSVTKTLAVPIGKKAGGVVTLDLHEKADGPHMLVAGTTGSGKTETILTYLASLCTYYSPEQVNILLMDMKGAGFVQRIGDEEQGNKLPHVVGTVTDITDNETGTGTGYMLKRFLDSMNAEVKRRKLFLKKMGVDSVDGYITAQEDLEKHVRLHPALVLEELKKLPPLPHLFVVIDEFTELMQFSSENSDVDFRVAITSLARIGRSLGFHIILISQNIENAITSDIRVNSRTRICLKVATRDASKEMIGTDLAASPLMPGNGRAYLLVGSGARFEYFQSGYSKADVTRNLKNPVSVTLAEMSGEYSLFYKQEQNDEAVKQTPPEDTSTRPDDETASKKDGAPDEAEMPVESGFAAEQKLPPEPEQEKEVYYVPGAFEDDLQSNMYYVPGSFDEEPLNAYSGISSRADDNGTDTSFGAFLDAPAETKENPLRSVEYTEEPIQQTPDMQTARQDTDEQPYNRYAEAPSDMTQEPAKEDVQRHITPNPEDDDKEKTGTTQLELLIDQIRLCFDGSGMEQPHCVFAPALPLACYYDYDWSSGKGKAKPLHHDNTQDEY